MVDPERRARIALLLRRLASGRLPAEEFEDAYYDLPLDTSDKAVLEIAYFGWTLFGDGDERLLGEKALSRSARREVARAVLFLGTAREYPWPLHPPLLTWRNAVRVLTVGLVRLQDPAWPNWQRTIDFGVWPFATQGDVATAASVWPFRSASHVRAV